MHRRDPRMTHKNAAVHKQTHTHLRMPSPPMNLEESAFCRLVLLSCSKLNKERCSMSTDFFRFLARRYKDRNNEQHALIVRLRLSLGLDTCKY